MPIKNYTTSVPANRSIDEIQKVLVNHGASGILFEYEKGTGRIQALRFKLPVKEGNEVGFSLPVNWRLFQAVLKKQEVRRADDEDYIYRVAWRNIRDWVMAQMALYETEMVDLPQVFFPFANTKNGKTIYEQIQSQGFLLGDGK